VSFISFRKGGFLQTASSKVHSYENPFSRSLRKKKHHAKGFGLPNLKPTSEREFIFK
jgi:hypothetical protein